MDDDAPDRITVTWPGGGISPKVSWPENRTPIDEEKYIKESEVQQTVREALGHLEECEIEGNPHIGASVIRLTNLLDDEEETHG